MCSSDLGPCRTVSADDDPNAATYRLPVASGDGYTLFGAPTVIAVLAATGPNAQVVARLWDVAADGMQTLVTHTLYRPRTDNRGPQVFQLQPPGVSPPATSRSSSSWGRARRTAAPRTASSPSPRAGSSSAFRFAKRQAAKW